MTKADKLRQEVSKSYQGEPVEITKTYISADSSAGKSNSSGSTVVNGFDANTTSLLRPPLLSRPSGSHPGGRRGGPTLTSSVNVPFLISESCGGGDVVDGSFSSIPVANRILKPNQILRSSKMARLKSSGSGQIVTSISNADVNVAEGNEGKEAGDRTEVPQAGLSTPPPLIPQSCVDLAIQSWQQYLKLNDSIVTDLFAGQLQSTVECLTCHTR